LFAHRCDRKGQLDLILQKLGLTRGGQPATIEERLEPNVLYVLDDDEDITGMPSVPSISDATSLAACRQLIGAMSIAPAPFFKFGRCFATIMPRGGAAPSKVRLWLVIKNHTDCVYCIRIRTYQGHGIRHLAADKMLHSLELDPTKRKHLCDGTQKDIDAHAVVFPKGRRAPLPGPEEPHMMKESLGIVLDFGLDTEVLDRMSRACFTRIYQIGHNEEVASVGQIDKYSLPYLVRYVRDMYEGAR
jgi:hypothetical protein